MYRKKYGKSTKSKKSVSLPLRSAVTQLVKKELKQEKELKYKYQTGTGADRVNIRNICYVQSQLSNINRGIDPFQREGQVIFLQKLQGAFTIRHNVTLLETLWFRATLVKTRGTLPGHINSYDGWWDLTPTQANNIAIGDFACSPSSTNCKWDSKMVTVVWDKTIKVVQDGTNSEESMLKYNINLKNQKITYQSPPSNDEAAITSYNYYWLISHYSRNTSGTVNDLDLKQTQFLSFKDE